MTPDYAKPPSWPYWLMATFILLALVYAHQAKAETAIWAGAWSIHPFSDEDYTSSHDLVAVESHGFLAARYRNSYGRESYAAGIGKSWRYGDVRLSGYVGATTGYSECWGDDGGRSTICPMFVGAAHYTRYRVQPGVLIFGEAVAVSFRVELY